MNVVEKQLEAYNNKNIDLFMDCYDDNIKVFEFPNKIIFSTHDEMRNHYENLFLSYPVINAEILKRIEYENYVIDHELVTGKNEPLKAIAMYELKGNKIINVWFL